MSNIINARRLANYILALNDFPLQPKSFTTYGHMGAILSDAILQSGVNYKKIVLPRIKSILTYYSEAYTTDLFSGVIDEYGSNVILDWNHPEKPRRLEQLVSYLICQSVQTESELKDWLLDTQNCKNLLSLKGIGPKTVDYMKKLVDIQTVAVDRHIRQFVSDANIECTEYNEIKIVVEYAADLLAVPRSNLDYSIWVYVSSKKYHNFYYKQMSLFDL